MTYLLENKMTKGHKMYSLMEMLRYKRPEGSVEQRQFCKRFLEPVFGFPDEHGNYIKIIGDTPHVAFMSHHDTVHKNGGMQTPYIRDDVVYISEDCLGADCTTGIWVMLQLIELGVEGVYVVFAGEEIGCVGSSKLLQDNPLWIEHVDIAISFDRWGTRSIITHQMCERTCSDVFAISLADQLGMGHEPDTKGSFTDSNEFRGVISECTNLSVGYYQQHTAREHQDLLYLYDLVEALSNVDWESLPVERTPVVEFDECWPFRRGFSYQEHEDNMYTLVRDNPQVICDILESYGIGYNDILEEMFNLEQNRRIG